MMCRRRHRRRVAGAEDLQDTFDIKSDMRRVTAQERQGVHAARQIGDTAGFDRFQIRLTDAGVLRDLRKIKAEGLPRLAEHLSHGGGTGRHTLVGLPRQVVAHAAAQSDYGSSPSGRGTLSRDHEAVKPDSCASCPLWII